jgi:hypothetical protein
MESALACAVSSNATGISRRSDELRMGFPIVLAR